MNASLRRREAAEGQNKVDREAPRTKGSRAWLNRARRWDTNFGVLATGIEMCLDIRPSSSPTPRSAPLSQYNTAARPSAEGGGVVATSEPSASGWCYRLSLLGPQ